MSPLLDFESFSREAVPTDCGFNAVYSRLIDQLRTARDTSEELLAVAPNESDTKLARSVASQVWDLLDELGCYE